MTALATIADVEAVSRAVPDADVAQVERLLEMVSANVRRYTGQTFDLVVDDAVEVWPIDGEVWLAQRPVIEVTAVSEFGSGNLAAGTYEASQSGRLYRVYQQYRQPWRCGKLTVTYTHGYAEIPADIAQVVAEKVAERWNASAVNPTQISGSGSQDVGGYSSSQTYRIPSADTEAWSGLHREVLDSYKRGKSGSVRLR